MIARVLAILIFAMVLVPCAGLAPARQDAAQPARLSTRFVSVDIFVDSGDRPLAAYQVEFKGTVAQGAVKLVGIEGNADPGRAFSAPPGYDPAALAHDRVIIADFSTLPADRLPRGNSRVARLHLMIESPAPDAAPAYTVNLIAAGAPDGVHIQASASVIEGEAP